MSDEQACKSEDQHRIDTLEELANAERELRSAKTRFEQAQWEVVKAAESLLEWRENWSRLRNAALSCYPAAVPVERVLEDAQATIDRFCAEVNARNADLDKAISALTPEDGKGLDGLLDHGQQETSPVQSAIDQDKARELPVGQAAEILGYEEAKRGAAFGDNPYDHSTISHTYWDAGWTRACHEKMAEDVINTPPTDTVAAVEIPEGFIPWSGGECPVDRLSKIEVILKSGHRDRHWLAGDWDGPSQDLSHWSADFGEGRIIAYKVISEPAEASEPAEIISTLTGDPAIEPESGLHDEQSQSDPITNPDASFWTAGFEEDRKPKPGFIEGAVSKLFGVKEPA